MSDNKGNLIKGKVESAKVPQPPAPTPRRKNGKVVAPKVPRPSPTKK